MNAENAGFMYSKAESRARKVCNAYAITGGFWKHVGKIAVPAEILSKSTRLSKPEFDLVKKHAQRSYEILKGVEFPWPVAEAAWQHHERLDGAATRAR